MVEGLSEFVKVCHTLDGKGRKTLGRSSAKQAWEEQPRWSMLENLKANSKRPSESPSKQEKLSWERGSEAHGEVAAAGAVLVALGPVAVARCCSHTVQEGPVGNVGRGQVEGRGQDLFTCPVRRQKPQC